MDCIICLGKNLNDDGSLDWIFQERVNLAAKLFQENPNSTLILTGGKSHADIRNDIPTQASAMLAFIKSKSKTDETRIILEEEGESTIHQLCIIKNDILLPRNFKNIALVTDEIHLPRATKLAEWIFGDEFILEGFGSIVNLGGESRAAIEKYEKEKYQLTIDTIINKFVKGDDEAILEFENKIREAKRKYVEEGGDQLKIVKAEK